MTKIDVSDSAGDDAPTEDVTLTVGAIQQRYVPSNAGAAPMIAGWDQVTNSPMSPDWTAPVF